MGEWTAVAILFMAIVYLIVRILLFANMTRRKQEASVRDKETLTSSQRD